MRPLFFIFPAIMIAMLAKTVDSNTSRMPEAKEPRPVFSFGIFTDAHYCDADPQESRFYRLSEGKLREALELFRSDSVKFVVNLGDIIDHGFSSYRKVLEIIDSSGLKVYHITGNHDYSVDNEQKSHLPLPQPSTDGYYSFIIDHFRIIALNGNELSTYATADRAKINEANNYISELRAAGSQNAIDWNGGISLKQMNWLKSQLDEAVAGKEKVIILCHFPVYPEDKHNLLNYREVIAIISNYHNIIAYFAGHNHAGNYGNFNLIHFVTLKGMVETENMNSYAQVDVYPNRIWIKGYGREKSQILAY